MIDEMLGPEEFFSRFKGRFFGKYRALVVRNDDPRMLGRVKVVCEPVYGTSQSPWALPCTPLGGSVDGGCFFVPDVDTMVWVEFEEGQPSSPIYTGGFWDDTNVGRPSDGSPIERSEQHQGNQNPVPMHAQGIPDGSDLDGSMRGQRGVPSSGFKGKYPNVRVMQTPSGHRLEFDDTEGAERVMLMHRSGSMIEIRPDGSIHEISAGVSHKFAKAATRHTEGNERVTTKGSRVEDIDGDLIINVGGVYRINYGKSAEATLPSRSYTISGDDNEVVNGSKNIEASNNVDIAAGGDTVIGAMGNLHLSSGGAGTLIWSNAFNTVQIADSLKVVGMNGRASFYSADPTGLASKIGIEAQSLGAAMSPTPVAGELGPHLKVGNLTLPSPPAMTPLLHEPLVLGMQLHLYLQALHAFLSGWVTDYVTHAHPWYSPAYTAPAMAALLPTQLASMQATWLTPTSPKGHPLLLSDLVFTSKT